MGQCATSEPEEGEEGAVVAQQTREKTLLEECQENFKAKNKHEKKQKILDLNQLQQAVCHKYIQKKILQISREGYNGFLLRFLERRRWCSFDACVSAHNVPNRYFDKDGGDLTSDARHIITEEIRKSDYARGFEFIEENKHYLHITFPVK